MGGAVLCASRNRREVLKFTNPRTMLTMCSKALYDWKVNEPAPAGYFLVMKPQPQCTGVTRRPLSLWSAISTRGVTNLITVICQHSLYPRPSILLSIHHRLPQQKTFVRWEQRIEPHGYRKFTSIQEHVHNLGRRSSSRIIHPIFG